MVLGALLLISGAVGAVWFSMHRSPTPVPVAPAMQEPADPTTLTIYTSGQYGLSFFYPSIDMLTDAFTASSTVGGAWRASAVATGTPIVSVADTAGELRVGRSTDKRELKACVKAGPAETTLGPLQVGSTTFAVFGFDRVGTDNERRITSYRVVHDSACYAVELLEPLARASTTPDAALSRMLESFSFARP